jgi:hypothetical protein
VRPARSSVGTMTIRVRFIAGDTGDLLVERITAICGESLPEAKSLLRVEGSEFVAAPGAVFTLDGVRSHERYVERAERDSAGGRSRGPRAPGQPLCSADSHPEVRGRGGRSRRTSGAPSSRHARITPEVGLRYLPAIARRLYHSRDLGGPFDFLTFFEFGEADASAFDDLLGTAARDRGVVVRGPRSGDPAAARRGLELRFASPGCS